MSEDNIRDILETALDEHDPSSDSVALAEPEVEIGSERARDEAGRFTKAEREAQQAVADAQGEPVKSQRPPRPSSWKKDYQEKWDQIADTDPQMAQYLMEREQQFASGVSTYKAEAERSRGFQTLLEPHAPRFQQYGADPQEYVGRLLRMDEILATGTMQQKQEILLSIAQAVGLTEAEEIPQGQGYVPPELLNTVSGLRSELNALKQENERTKQLRLSSEIDSFAVDHPYLDDVLDPMAQLLETGLASNIEDAYKKAVRLSDDVFEKFQSQQQQTSELDRQRKARETAARARSAAVSPRSSTPTGAVTASTQGGDLRSIIEEQTNSVLSGGGRI